MSERKEYPGLDIIRFILALLVVAIHYAPFADYSVLLSYGISQYIARLAVPTFFIITGFFVTRSMFANAESAGGGDNTLY